jgi:hypothetical protein
MKNILIEELRQKIEELLLSDELSDEYKAALLTSINSELDEEIIYVS